MGSASVTCADLFGAASCCVERNTPPFELFGLILQPDQDTVCRDLGHKARLHLLLVELSVVIDTAGVRWCVYTMRMARVNVYLPDELAEEAKAAGLNVSGLTQAAVRGALNAGHTDEWLADVVKLPRTGVTHHDVAAAVEEARRELDG
jgi:post-segregation antitoxin (ccd killing protein)